MNVCIIIVIVQLSFEDGTLSDLPHIKYLDPPSRIIAAGAENGELPRIAEPFHL